MSAALYDHNSRSEGQQTSADTKICAPVKDGSFGRIDCKPREGTCTDFLGSIQNGDAAMMQTACHRILDTQARAIWSAINTSS